MEDEWIIEDPSESAAEEAPAAQAAAAEPAQPVAPAAAEVEAEPQVVLGTDPKKLIFKHWVRPKFLQYGYMYDYRHNYYDDVIDFLDRRQRGVIREPPRAQTWAERALRTYVSKCGATSQIQKDKRLLAHISHGARFHRYHSKSLISRKYSSLGFTTITI